jgi:hypothetical protein
MIEGAIVSALTSEVVESISRRQFVVFAIASSAFLAALYIFVHDQQAIGAINYWWADELYSLWASDPAQRFGDALSERILPDSNPPLYYFVLYWTRQIIVDARSATAFINLLALAAAVLSVLYASKKTDNLPLGLIGCAVFLLSGPVLRYTAEGRVYLSALALTFVASWFSASAILSPRRPPALTSFALLGALGAMTHVYSALMCCCLAAGLLAVCRSQRRSDLWAPSLALGLPAGALTLVWLAYAYAAGSFWHVGWIRFSLDKLVVAAGEVILYAFPLGANVAAIDFDLHTASTGLRDALVVAFPGIIATGLIILILGVGFTSKRLRPLGAAFGICFLLFFLLPVAASFKQPIITARYWMIGAPAVTVLLLFFIRGWVDDVKERPKAWPASLGPAAAATAFVCLTTLHGFDAARASVMAKPVWSGGPLISSMIEKCPPRSVHILIDHPTSLAPWEYAYAFVSKRSGDTFIPVIVIGGESGTYSSPDPSCPVLGWAEQAIPNITDADLQMASDRELLDLLKIDAAPAEVQILRHRKGYVVLRRNSEVDP